MAPTWAGPGLFLTINADERKQFTTVEADLEIYQLQMNS